MKIILNIAWMWIFCAISYGMWYLLNCGYLVTGTAVVVGLIFYLLTAFGIIAGMFQLSQCLLEETKKGEQQ